MPIYPQTIKIAVIGARASGKSYLLYDMIHAFSLLGYHPEELPLAYPHSSFGAYFYDAFNCETGGMRGTESYACRPESHYGAWLSRHIFDRRLKVDFLNIPGEAFDSQSQRLPMFFDLMRQIENKGKGLFFLSEWKSPSGRFVRLIVPPNFDFNSLSMVMTYSQSRFGNYMSWDNIYYELMTGHYREVKRKSVSGTYMLRHMTEILTDSVLLTLEECWNHINTLRRLDLQEYKAHRVLHYFYPILYCMQATDIIICDNLMEDGNIGQLAETLSVIKEQKTRQESHVYLAFRGADLIWQTNTTDRQNMEQAIATDPSARNTLYGSFLDELQAILTHPHYPPVVTRLSDDNRRHILQSIGDGVGHAFWHLLNTTTGYGSIRQFLHRLRKDKTIYELSHEAGNKLPPHVYFTATPIDTCGCIYRNDPNDMTRFYSDEGQRLRSFTKEISMDPMRHMCFGSYQLLTDILYQNGITTKGLHNRSELLRHIQNKL